MTRLAVLAIALIAVLTFTATAAAQQTTLSAQPLAARVPAYTFVTIAGPSSSFTTAFGINGSGTVVGTYTEQATGNSYGFVRSSDGNYTSVTHGADPYVKVGDIDSLGRMIGWWSNPSGPSGYFIRVGSTNTDIALGSNYAVLSLNASDSVVGWYLDQPQSAYRGFVGTLEAIDGSLSGNVNGVVSFNYPNAAATFPQRINNSGQIAGYYRDTSGIYHGFVRSADGTTYTNIDFPVARTKGTAISTYVYGINNNGKIVGTYSDASGVYHGFTGSAAGPYTTIDEPQAKGKGAATYGYAINDNGQIVGYYDTRNTEYGFLATPNII